MDPDEVQTKSGGGFTGWVSAHKWWVIGGAGVLGVGIFFYERHKSASTAQVGSVASSISAGSGNGGTVAAGGGGTGGGISGTAAGGSAPSGFAGSVFAGVLAKDFNDDIASTLAQYATKKGSGSAQTGATTGGSSSSGATGGTTGPGSPVVQPKASIGVPVAAKTSSGTVTGTATTPPTTVTVDGISFKPTRKVVVGGKTYYGIPDAVTANKLRNKKANVSFLLGGKGQYVQA
jgi:hypothetical protein